MEVKNINTEKILEALEYTDQVKIVVFGDYALDKYLYIDPKRDESSVETGLIAYQVHQKKLYAGVGGTITNNLCSLGVQVFCIGIIGDDGEGYELLRELKRIGADISFMVQTKEMCTATYTKPMRKDENGVYKEMNRFDFRNYEEPSEAVQEKLLEHLEKVLQKADAVIIADQYVQRNQGAVTDMIRERLSALALKYQDKIFYADSRAFSDEYRNMIVKCNNLELFEKIGEKEGNADDLEAIRERGLKIAERNGKLFFVTRGSRGMAVFDDGMKIIPAYRVQGDIDIVGAGDAANAGIVTGLALGLKPEEAALLGCCVSSITIQQIGTTGAATVEQVQERMLAGNEEGH